MNLYPENLIPICPQLFVLSGAQTNKQNDCIIFFNFIEDDDDDKYTVCTKKL